MNTPSKRVFALICLVSAAAFVATAQTTPFTGFTSGNLVLSRSVYTGDAYTVVAGQPLPPVCPASALKQCGNAAVNNGVYPGVWNNDGPDASFGITSPIFLDQITPAGTLVNTMAVPPNMIVTSFSSKSELAVNLSTDGTALTFMGYVAPPNTVDVSNSNTPGVYDPTNPAGGSYYRAVAQVGANGNIQVTPTNAYNGNNGRAAILAKGLYYMVGNSNNGTGTPANVVAAGGVQIATPGQSAATAPVKAGSFSISEINPATGQPYAVDSKDKPGKDDNFRGLTIFNNTLYISKGSGSNGIDTVYQVGTAGSLPTPGTSAYIAPLPGLSTISARLVGATDDYPFGIWFANSTTMYVADEGDGVMADAVTSPSAGLQKWILVSGTWIRAYVMQNGLNLGKPYAVSGYPASLSPATDGLRNITGKVNNDGTVTVWGVTSTVSTNGDQGADPNQLVMITDNLVNTEPVVGAQEQFTTVRTANAGEVLRGIGWAPTAGSTPTPATPLVLSAASPSVIGIAPGGLAFAQGQNLAAAFASDILGPFLPDYFGGATVTIKDSAGTSWPAPLLSATPWQITFQVPAGVAPGNAQVSMLSAGATETAANVPVAAVAPAIFTLNGSGLAAAIAMRMPSSGSQIIEPAYALNAEGGFQASPINMGSSTDMVYLTLYGTGIQSAGAAKTSVTVNGVTCPIQFVGPQGNSSGLDQVNVLLPHSLAGTGSVNVQLTAGGVAANSVEVTIQ